MTTVAETIAFLRAHPGIVSELAPGHPDPPDRVLPAISEAELTHVLWSGTSVAVLPARALGRDYAQHLTYAADGTPVVTGTGPLNVINPALHG